MPRKATRPGQAVHRGERSQRQLRVGEELRHRLAELLERGVFADPALADVIVTVTEVRVSPDLGNATVFVVPLGGGNVEPVVTALNHASGFLRRGLARLVELRIMPRLVFAADTAFDQANRVAEILRRPKVARDLEADQNEADQNEAGEDKADGNEAGANRAGKDEDDGQT